MGAHHGAEGPLAAVLLIGPRLALGAAAAVGTAVGAAAVRVGDGVGRAQRAVLRRVVAAVVDQLDLDALVARVDVNRVAERVDVNRVADRVDVERVARRVDLDAVLDRLDPVALTRQVLEEIDIGRIVRDTGGGMTGEALDAVRLRSARADRLVDAFADRLLRRNGTVPSSPSARTGDDGGGPGSGGPAGRTPP
ncbi:hypothetical protein A6A06_13620 [Streptomyces sp. CB02923]|uniref:hypothetical protein n=1 Tax=Streptomyces sp. CB02923 TaxID=1718985 RepID=UPI00093EFB92|nr:hypothetical protein [Streptomyces sp. CB02923]OKI02120.1 hypothetical protein A6A06_13620 [Streptomyces sp. CB02923]